MRAALRAGLVDRASRPGARVRVHREHLGAELREHRRHHDRRGTVRVVEHDLEPAVAEPLGVDATARAPRCRTRSSGAGTRCRRCRRRTPGGSPRGGAAARSCAASAVVDVAAVGVEEADLDAVGIVGREPDRDAPARLAVAHLEAGERHGGELDVLDVGARRGSARRSPRASSARATRLVSRLAVTTEPAWQRRAVGHRDPHRRPRG